ncbi:MAG: DUF4838 domain-containing protein [Clostridia bacterium]|nr:DUF4838 domain-containing protein [Clostridia bacterium]
MLTINKLISNPVVDYAAEELRKYLRMMMPERGDVKINYDPDASCGFRLGLMQDAGLDISDAQDPELDDLIYIDCDTDGGMIAGDNPRSVLIAVYEYLRQNGCEWPMPGVDGELIPMQDIVPVKLRHKPSMRYRGSCQEGAPGQHTLNTFFEWMPKVGFNTFMIQFRIPKEFYDRYYNRLYYKTPRPKAPLSLTQMQQWSALTECEMQKRGIMIHWGGHGWTNDPFGVDSLLAWRVLDNSIIPEDYREFFALRNGVRGFYNGRPANTQFCMSNARARELFVNYVVEYAKKHTGIDYLHIWLGDANGNHCECEHCYERTVSDWYMILLNEVDAELSAAGLTTKIVFIAYEDTTWAPVTEKINNPERFTLMIAPISRDYDKTLGDPDPSIVKVPFVRNKMRMTQSLEEYFMYFDDWKKIWHGSNVCFEYHFWRNYFHDLSGQVLAKRIYEDTRAYKENGIAGIIQCGAQRSFFPNGYPMYLSARVQYDINLPLDKILENYYTAAYGEAWEQFRDTLRKLSDAVPYAYISAQHAEKRKNTYYDPTMVPRIEKLKDITKELRALIKDNYNSDYRVRTVSVRLLEVYCEYVDRFSDMLKRLAMGEECDAEHDRIIELLVKWEDEYETYFDICIADSALSTIKRTSDKIKSLNISN